MVLTIFKLVDLSIKQLDCPYTLVLSGLVDDPNKLIEASIKAMEGPNKLIEVSITLVDDPNKLLEVSIRLVNDLSKLVLAPISGGIIPLFADGMPNSPPYLHGGLGTTPGANKGAPLFFDTFGYPLFANKGAPLFFDPFGYPPVC